MRQPNHIFLHVTKVFVECLKRAMKLFFFSKVFILAYTIAITEGSRIPVSTILLLVVFTCACMLGVFIAL